MKPLALPCLAAMLHGSLALAAAMPALVNAASGLAPAAASRVTARPASAAECSGIPGALVHDDGTYESGFGGYFKTVDTSEFVERFTPSVYPATLASACVAFSNIGPGVENFDFNIRVYADDGDGDGPGTLLGSQLAHIDQLPEYVPYSDGQFLAVDLSTLALNVPHGSVYIGAEWNDMLYPGNFVSINSDGWSGGPFGGGYYRNTFTPWTSMYRAFLSDYRALQIRAVERALQPTLAIDATAMAIDDHCIADPTRGNGVAEPGETIDFSVPVFASSGDFTAVRATLTPPAPAGVRYITASATSGDLVDGARASATFRIELDGGIGCLQDILLPLSISSDQGDFSTSVKLPIGRALADIAPAGMPLKIPNWNEQGIASTMEVPQSAPLSDLSVRVKLDHFDVSDLIIRLTSPAGTTITLLDRPGFPPFPGCENSVGDILFIDGAADPEHVCAEPAGGTPWPVDTAAPVQPLATFVGENMRGTWTLTVIDPDPNNSGALTGWSLQPLPALQDACAVCPEAPDPIFSDGFDGN